MTRLEQFYKIFVLVSGGIDSTYLYEKLKKFYKEKVYPVNCFNPYEQSETLNQIKKDPNFIEIKPDEHYNYGEILRNAFLKLPKAYELKKKGKYHKHIFECCYYIKHKAFLENLLFKQSNVIVISGIKAGNGQRRFKFLAQLRKGSKYISQSKTPNNYYFLTEGLEKSTFFHKHKGGQIYAYPYRDYYFKELPDICIRRLKKIYPTLKHSGCYVCPVLVLFNVWKGENKERYTRSVKYAHKLGVLNYKPIDSF